MNRPARAAADDRAQVPWGKGHRGSDVAERQLITEALIDDGENLCQQWLVPKPFGRPSALGQPGNVDQEQDEVRERGLGEAVASVGQLAV